MTNQIGGAQAAAPAPVAQQQGWQKPDWYGLVWPERNAIAPQWLEQGFQFSNREVFSSRALFEFNS